MMDQAHTLRRMMNELEGKLFLGTTFVPIISLVFAKSRQLNQRTKETLIHFLNQQGIKLLCVSEDFTHSGVKRESPTLWSVSPETLKQSPLDDSDLCDRGVKAILIDTQAGIDEERLCLHGPHHRTVVILTDHLEDQVAAYQIIKSLVRRVGVKKVDILVVNTQEARAGERIFTQLHELCCRFLDTQLQYLGSVQCDEKNQDRRFQLKFLLDYKTRSAQCVELESVGKRLGLIPAQYVPFAGKQ